MPSPIRAAPPARLGCARSPPPWPRSTSFIPQQDAEGYTGERLQLPESVDVAGYAPLKLELYLARGGEPPGIQIACAGTLVADDITELDALGLGESPWRGRGLSGLIDFPAFRVPPGTRRGVIPDRAAAAFVEALERLRDPVEAEIARLRRARDGREPRRRARSSRCF